MNFLKNLIRAAIRRTGYQIQKYPTFPFSSVPVFDLSVHMLMTTRGQQVSFIQIGANDGRYGDPLRKYIMKYAWHGILVEPQPDIFARLCKNYASASDRLIFENVAISEGRTAIDMYKAAGGGAGHSGNSDYAASVVSTDPSVVAHQLRLRAQSLERFTVACTTIDQLIKKHGIVNIDVLQIDAEGHDYEVLKTLNLSAIRPLIIQFEHGHLSPREIDGAVAYLNPHGYHILYGGYQNDTIALNKSLLALLD